MMKKTYLGYKSKDSAKLFLLCWIAYFSTYICRLNFSVCMPELTKNNILSETQIAAVSSAFFICYGAGQLFSGILGDRVSPRILIFIGTFVSAISNLMIFLLYSSHICLTLLWGLNGIVQSLVWSPILRIAGDYFDGKDRTKFGTDISTSVTLGTLASYGIGLATLVLLPWRYVFLTCGLCTLAASIFWFVETGKLKLYNNTVKITTQKGDVSLSFKQFMKLFITSGCLVMIIPIAIHGTLKDSVTQWIPTFFSDKFNFGTDISVLLTMVLPIVNVSGAYIARAINNKLQNVLKTSVVFFAVTMVFLALMRIIGINSAVFSLLCVAVITTAMHAANVMFITMVPLSFTKYSCVSTVAGLLNATAYIGCGALNLVAGKVLSSSQSSWDGLFIFWLAICVAAIFVTVYCSVVWKKFNAERTGESAIQNKAAEKSIKE